MPPSLAKLELPARSEPAPRKPRRGSFLLLAIGLTATAPIARAQATVETAPSPTTGQPQYTLRARVPLTIVDVVVTDAKGHPVHGLQQSDFTLLEANQPMHPNSFEEHRSDEALLTAPTPLNLPPDTFTNASPVAPNAGPINILLIDNLNTPTQVQQRVQLEMLAYIKRMPPGVRMAVLGLTYRLFIIQGITTDPDLLKAAITNKKNMWSAPPLEDPAQDAAAPDTTPTAEQLCNLMAQRGQYTMEAMRQIARYLSGMPGRKNLIWFSGSFPPKWPADDPTCYDFTGELNAATSQLANAHVVINPIESRGLRIDNNSNRKLLEEHYNMDLRADQTGGHAVYTSNDLAGAVEDAINLGANYYTLTYTPTNQTLDTRFRTITVKVDQPNLHLTYRNGYYAVAPEVTLAGKAIEKVTPMQAAMMRGSLEPTQILFKVRVTQSPATDAKLSPDNQPDPKQMKPPYRHYTIAYAIDIHGIDLSPAPDGNYRGGFEYGVRVYNSDGDEIVNSVSKTVNPVLPPAVYKSMLAGGANAHQQIDLPATGNYFLRIAVHDLTTDHLGAIEIPAASISPSPTAGKE